MKLIDQIKKKLRLVIKQAERGGYMILSNNEDREEEYKDGMVEGLNMVLEWVRELEEEYEDNKCKT